MKKRVLVTGMAGQIGGIIRRELGERYELSGITGWMWRVRR